MIRVLQFICPSGLYGAEMWVLALLKHLDGSQVSSQLAITHESQGQNIELLKRARDLGVQVHPVPMSGRFDPRGVVRLARLLREERIDILHSHGYKSDIMGLLAAGPAGVRNVSTPHGFENAADVKLRTFIRVGCHALRRFDMVAPLSEELREDMARLKIPDSRVRLIRNGVDLKEIEEIRLAAGGERERDKHSRVIGYVGQLASRKNLSNMVRAFDLLFSERPDVRLVIVGDGNERGQLEMLARSLPCRGNVEFLGYREDRLRHVMGFDIFSMTSSLEGIPRCMMEAMALEKPVVAFRIPGVDRLVVDGETGLLAEFGDLEGLRDCWRKLLDDEEAALEMGKRGRERILQQFSARRMADEYTALYREMVAARSKGRAAR